MYGWVYGLHLGYVAMHMQHDEPYLTDCEPIDWAEYERWRAFPECTHTDWPSALLPGCQG